MSTHYSQAEMARVILATPACLEASSRNHSLPNIVTLNIVSHISRLYKKKFIIDRY